MRKRQRKKNQKKFEQWWTQYLIELQPIIQQCQEELREHCRWHGHDYIFVEWSDYRGYICRICAKKITAEELTNKQRANIKR